MKKGNTVYEDKAEKEAARRKKHQEYMEKHTVECPHCGKKVLDHMTECPECKGKLTPRGYTPMDSKTQKIVRSVLWSIGIAAMVAILIYIFFFK